jgi:hypothetical protein
LDKPNIEQQLRTSQRNIGIKHITLAQTLSFIGSTQLSSQDNCDKKCQETVNLNSSL